MCIFCSLVCLYWFLCLRRGRWRVELLNEVCTSSVRSSLASQRNITIQIVHVDFNRRLVWRRHGQQVDGPVQARLLPANKSRWYDRARRHGVRVLTTSLNQDNNAGSSPTPFTISAAHVRAQNTRRPLRFSTRRALEQSHERHSETCYVLLDKTRRRQKSRNL